INRRLGLATVSDPFIVRGRWVLPGGDDPEAVLQDGAVVVRDERIEEIGSWTELRARYPDAAVFGSERHAVLPGLVNAHHHSNAVTAIQQGIPDQLLEPWLLSLARRRRV